MTELSPAQKAAFDLVRTIASDWLDQGRRAYSAALKPELLKRTFGSFDETALGFGSFRGFLVAARDEGVIELHPAPRGPDVQVVPTGRDPLPADTPRRHPVVTVSVEPVVREDLWSAWIDWNPGVNRYYDRERNRAYRLPSYESPLDSEDIKALRADIAAHPKRFIEIKPVTFDEQVAWMKEFADQQQPEIRLPLMTSLESPRPARDFAAATRATPAIARLWAAERVRRVSERIQDFQKEHDLEFPIMRPVRTAGGEETEGERRKDTAKGVPIDVKTLRARLHGAIEEMPVADLLALNVRVGHLFDVRQ